MKKGLLTLLVGFLLLLIFMLVRTWTYGVRETSTIALPEVPSFDEAAAVVHLSKAVQFQTVTTVSGEPATPEAAAPWLAFHDWLEETYPAMHQALRQEIHADYTLLYTWTGSDASLAPLMLMAHQDVVPVDAKTRDAWDADPFAGAIKDGYVIGRGVLDDKGALIGIVEAIETLVSSGFTPKRTVLIVFGHDEEVSGAGAQAVAAALERRGIRPEMVLDEGFFVVKDSPFAKGPLGLIGVSEKGYLTLRIVSEAVGGHSSTPPRDSANVQLSKAILALEENQMPSYLGAAPIAQMFENIAHEMPFGQRFAMANQWALGGAIDNQLANIATGNALVRTTTAPTMLNGSIKENILPQQSSAIVNFRIHPNDTTKDVIGHVEKVIKDIEGVRVERLKVGGIASEPMPISDMNSQGFDVLQSVARNIGSEEVGPKTYVPVAPSMVMGATDSRYMVDVADNIYRFVPAQIHMDDVTGVHGTNERIKVESVAQLVRGYMQIIMSMDHSADGE